MPLDAFAPFRIRPEEDVAEAEAFAAETSADPLVAGATDGLPLGLGARTWALVSAGAAADDGEACRAADGSPSGAPGRPSPCLHSEAYRRRVIAAALAALDRGRAPPADPPGPAAAPADPGVGGAASAAGGHQGLMLDRPDASLALGLLGAVDRRPHQARQVADGLRVLRFHQFAEPLAQPMHRDLDSSFLQPSASGDFAIGTTRFIRR